MALKPDISKKRSLSVRLQRQGGLVAVRKLFLRDVERTDRLHAFSVSVRFFRQFLPAAKG